MIKYKEFDRVIVPPDYGPVIGRGIVSFVHTMNLSTLKAGDAWYLTDEIQMAHSTRDSFRAKIKNEAKKILGDKINISLTTVYMGGFECIRIIRNK